MTLNELRYIVAVAQERSFGRAAAKCFVSQPALSVAIQKLEEELGAPLFERGKSEVTITPVGERIVEQAQKVLEETARIREIAQSGRNQLVGVLRLGVIYTVGPYLLPDLVPALHALAPQGTEPAFVLTQGLVLVLFVIAGFIAVRRFHPAAAQSALAAS